MVEKDSNNRKKEELSVEQNVSPIYVPKNKLGGLPMDNSVDPEIKKEMDKTKENIERFKEDILKQFRFIEAIGIIPAQASRKIEEEFEISEENSKKNLMHTLVVIPEKKFKDIQKIKLECIKTAKLISDRLWVHVLTPVDIWNLGLDSKSDILEAIGMSYPILDKGLLGALRISSIHKSLVLRKFEKYITSYVVGGSLVRGEAKPTSDIDVFIIIDDTDVKRMPRFELKEKLRSVIFQFIQEATMMAGAKNPLSPQVYLLTEFWDSVKDAHPVMFTFIRDGIPLYDRGTFLPWKSLLRMGKIKPSAEAVDMYMSSGDKLSDNVDRRLLDILIMDIFWGVSTPTQGLLMMYGLAPPVPKETVRLFREVFVEKEKLVEPKYADILEEIIIKYYKGYEHGKVKKISGVELQKIYEDAKDYIKRLKKLRSQIEKRIQGNSIRQTYKDVFDMLGTVLNKKGEAVLVRNFDSLFVKKGMAPKSSLENLKKIIKIKKDFELLEKDSKKTIGMKEVTTVESARRMGEEIINLLVEYSQRKDFEIVSEKRFVLKNKKHEAELLFLSKTFIIEKEKISVIDGESVVDSNVEDLNKALKENKNDSIKLTPQQILVLKKHFGEFELIR